MLSIWRKTTKINKEKLITYLNYFINECISLKVWNFNTKNFWLFATCFCCTCKYEENYFLQKYSAMLRNEMVHICDARCARDDCDYFLKIIHTSLRCIINSFPTYFHIWFIERKKISQCDSITANIYTTFCFTDVTRPALTQYRRNRVVDLSL